MPEAPGKIKPTQSTCAVDIRAPADKVPTPSQSVADNGAPADGEPNSSTCAPDSGVPVNVEPSPSQCAPESGDPDDDVKIPSPCPADISESNEKYDSETGIDMGLDFIIDSDFYMEHARDTPHCDPEPTPGTCTCCSLDSIERTDLNVLTLLRAEDKYAILSSGEESRTGPDLDEDADVFYDALESVDPTGHSGSTVREPGVLWSPDMLLLPVMPFTWFLTIMWLMMIWMRNLIREVWYDENGQGPPSNRTDKTGKLDHNSCLK